MNRLKKYSALLAAVQSADPNTRVGILRSAPDEFIKTLIEVVLNFLAGNISHSPRLYTKLKHHKTALRSVGRKANGSVRGMRNSLVRQKGGFLPFLLAPIIAASAGPAIARNVARSATQSAVNTALDTVKNRALGFVKAKKQALVTVKNRALAKKQAFVKRMKTLFPKKKKK